MKTNASSNYRRTQVEFYRKTRAALIRRGFTFRSWAQAQGVPYTTIIGAARRERAGVKAIAALQRLQDFLKNQNNDHTKDAKDHVEITTAI